MGDWTEGALCAQTDPELFFPAKGQWYMVRTAQRICAECPVKAECLTDALTDPSLEGIWGGATYKERQQLRMAAA